MKRILFVLIFNTLCASLFLAACMAGEKPVVFVSIVPQKFFVQQIGMDLFDVQAMVQPGASPATYEPQPSQMARLSSAAAYFAIGVPFEAAWLPKISAMNPKMKIIRTDRGIDKMAMVAHHHEDENILEMEGDHSILDPHIWLAPDLVKIQAASILAGLKQIRPKDRNALEVNYEQFIQKIDQLDTEIKSLLQSSKGREFMVFHPSWGYFAREYGLVQVPIEIEGKSPKPAQLGKLINFAKERKITVIFVQPQFSGKSAETIAREIGGRVVIADPLAEDWLHNLMDVAEKLSQASR